MNRKQKTSSNDHAAALDNFGSSTSPRWTARFEKCGPAGEYFAFQKLKNKRGKHHGQRQGRRSRQHIAVAQLIENAAIRIVKMDGEKIREPAMSTRAFMRVVVRMRIDLEELLRSRTVATSAVNQAVHLAQHRRKQEHQGQIAPGCPPNHAPENHGAYFTVTASLMR